MGNKTTTILEKAKDLLSKTPVNENNKVFLNRFSDNIKLIENTILNRSIEEIAAAYKQLNKQIEMIESGQTTCEEVDISELKDLLTTDIDLSLYTDDSKNKYESECRIALNTLMDINSSQSKIDLAVKKIKAAKEGLVIRPIVTITSNRSIYQNNYLENLIDGSVDTIAWLEHNQEIGDYIQFRFREPIKLSKVQVISTGAGGDIIGNADFQVSSDGSSWVTVGKLTSLEDQTINFDETSAKYARILLTSAKENWLKINEVIFNDKYFVDTANLKNELNNAFDEEKYTIDSYKAYLKAVEEAKNILEKENKTQEEVDNALTRLKEAEGNLQYRIADFSELEDLINKVEEMDLSKYTEDSVNALNTSLESANTVLNDDDATQNQVDEALANLTAAKEGLALKANKTLLTQTIAQADTLVSEGALEGVNTIVVENFNKALENAKEVEANENATQEEVNDAWMNLAQAIQMLDFKTDKTELNALIAECEALDLNKYEDEGKEEFQAALAHAKEISEREDVLTEESIKEAIDRLTAAKEALVEKPEIDTSLLEYLYNTVKDTDLTKYIDDGQDEFKAALENAKNVLDNPESQEQVDEAVRRLNNAYINLRLKASEETLRKLQSFATEAENIDESLYSAETLAMIQEVKNEVNIALADPNLTEDSAEKLLVKVEKAKLAIANPDGGNNTENPENPENPNNQGNSGKTNNAGNGNSGNNNNQGKVNGSNKEGKGNAVSTGDYSNIGLLSISLLVSLVGVTIFIGKKKKVN